jgi:hypothetical protein
LEIGNSASLRPNPGSVQCVVGYLAMLLGASALATARAWRQ